MEGALYRPRLTDRSCRAVRPVDGPVHTIEIITPTRHRYLSTVPTNGPPLWMELYPQAQRIA